MPLHTLFAAAVAIAASNAVVAGPLTVGPHGTYATVQAAIDASCGPDDSIRSETGSYLENLHIALSGRSPGISEVGRYARSACRRSATNVRIGAARRCGANGPSARHAAGLALRAPAKAMAAVGAASAAMLLPGVEKHRD